MSYYSRQPARMSLEAALEEERREVLELLEGRHASGTATAAHKDRPVNPTPPVRSLLDIPAGPPPVRHGSIAGIGVGVTPSSGRGPPVRSMIEPVISSPLRISSTTPSSPTDQEIFLGDADQPPRRSSDGTDHMLGEKRLMADKPQKFANYQFDMLPSVPNPGAQKRASGENPAPRAAQNKSSVAAMMSGLDLRALPSFARGRDSGRRTSTRGVSVDSNSPSRLGRSDSPRSRWLNAIASRPAKLVTDRGKVIDMDSAYKHLSDANLARSSGSLAALPKPGFRESDGSGVPIGSQEDGRLAKDLYDSENNPIDTSEEENDTTSSDDDATAGVDGKSDRGRKKSLDIDITSPIDPSKPYRPPQSLLEAAEEERQMVEEKLGGQSHLDPEPPKPVTTTKQAPKWSSNVHPRTSYDHSASTPNTPFGSEDEAELSDIKRAQKLSIQMSAVDTSIPNRAIRTIVRGDFPSIQGEAEEGRRRQRKYLVATDLSEESVYALEWTIGTILRDGDTMYAVYSVYEENLSPDRDVDHGTPVQIGEGAKAIQDAAAVVGSQTEETTNKSQSDLAHQSRALLARLGSGLDSKSGSVDSRAMSKAESDRAHAIESISQTCVRLLRKTVLQVRIAIEVIHCKSPKHMITEAIDGLGPTLVIVGARGRSAFKGVLLGSFSNYLVTNSSVPVMVARKKLKKQTKHKKTNIRLSNNLTTPKKLALAKVD